MKRQIVVLKSTTKTIMNSQTNKLKIPKFVGDPFSSTSSFFQTNATLEFLNHRVGKRPIYFFEFKELLSQSNIHLFVDQQSKLKFKERLGKVLINNCFHGMIVDEFQDMLVILIYENAQYNNNQDS